MVTAVVGGQYGSEGKGLIVGHVAHVYDVHVRVGAANAGHTFYVDNEKFVVQQLPCAAYANPDAVCVIGPGAMINKQIFLDECEANTLWRDAHGHPDLVVMVDQQAHVIQPHHVREEAGGDLAQRIGSTSTIAREGIGSAQAAKVLRREDCLLAKDVLTSGHGGGLVGEVCDTVQMLHDSRIGGLNILLEGTQGTGLSLTHGQFPYVTSRDTTASALAADCGFGPKHLDHVVLVCRTHPIRVAGNSGPFAPGSEEIGFERIGVSPEKTTVTKLKRRIATFSLEQVKRAALLNSATEIALTFCDYLAPSMYARERITLDASDQKRVADLVFKIQDATGVPVTYLGTGPKNLVELPAYGLERHLVSH